MANINIEIRKSISDFDGKESISVYASIPGHISLDQAKDFCEIFLRIIQVAESWTSQEDDK